MLCLLPPGHTKVLSKMLYAAKFLMNECYSNHEYSLNIDCHDQFEH